MTVALGYRSLQMEPAALNCFQGLYRFCTADPAENNFSNFPPLKSK